MSKKTINFCYNSQSPRKITQIQKGPLKISSLVDSFHNPQYEHIKLESKPDNERQINQKDKDRLKAGGQTSIIDKMDQEEKKQIPNQLKSSVPENPNEIVTRSLRPPHNIRLLQYGAVMQEPSDADFGLDPSIQSKVPENAQNQTANPKEKSNEEDIKKDEKQTKIEQNKQISPQKPKYTFAIAPPQQQKKSLLCNIFGCCEKSKQRTYPINE